jgi:hypothetical protein
MEKTFIEENYIKEEIKINAIWANVFAFIVMAMAIVLFGIPFFMIWLRNVQMNRVINTAISLQTWLRNFAILLLIFLPGMIAHELIHGVFFALFADNRFKSIKFGIMPASKLFSPYCHCKKKLRINHYRIAAIMPLVILGIIPAIISNIIGNQLLLFWGIIFIATAAGDILMFAKTLKEKKDTWIFDSPTDIGFDVYRKQGYLQ